MIEVQGISKSYRVDETVITAVDDASLTINNGEFVSVIGHSGSGKTTLLSIMGGILKPTSGTVKLDETDIYTLNDDRLSEYRADKMGYIFQFASLLPVMTARENLLLPTLFSTKKRREAEKDAIEYMGIMGLADKIDAYPYQLSGGQQRRVAIARTLMNSPEVILADEPTGDLDEETEADVMKFLMSVNKERGITFVLVTHSTSLAKMAERQFKMSYGKIEEIQA